MRWSPKSDSLPDCNMQRGSLTMLGWLVTGAARRAAVCAKWYSDAVCHTFHSQTHPDNKEQQELSTKIPTLGMRGWKLETSKHNHPKNRKWTEGHTENKRKVPACKWDFEAWTYEHHMLPTQLLPHLWIKQNTEERFCTENAKLHSIIHLIWSLLLLKEENYWPEIAATLCQILGSIWLSLVGTWIGFLDNWTWGSSPSDLLSNGDDEVRDDVVAIGKTGTRQRFDFVDREKLDEMTDKHGKPAGRSWSEPTGLQVQGPRSVFGHNKFSFLFSQSSMNEKILFNFFFQN